MGKTEIRNLEQEKTYFAYNRINMFLNTKEEYIELLNEEIKEQKKEITKEEAEEKAEEKWKEHIKEYKSYLRRLPTLIIKNGLIQTLLYIKKRTNKKLNAWYYIYIAIEEWIIKEDYFGVVEILEDQNNNEDIIRNIINIKDQSSLKYFEKEIIELSSHLKKMAEGLIEVSYSKE